MSRDDPPAPADVLARWALQFVIPPWTTRAAIRSVDETELRHGRVTWIGRRRRVVRRVAAMGTADRTPGPDNPLDAPKDPWSVSPGELEQRSRRVTACSACKGSGTTSCDTCGGSAEAQCPTCSGARKVRSTRTGEVSACGACKGTGSAACGCGNGRVRCGICLGQCRVVERLIIIEEPVRRVLSAGDARAAFAIEAVGQLRVDWQGPAAIAPPEAAEWRDRVVAPKEPGVRWDGISVQVAAVPAARVSFRLSGVEATAEVVDGSLRPSGAARWPFFVRLVGIPLVGAAGLAWGSAVWMAYVERHLHYVFTVNTGYLWLLIPAFGLVAAAMAAGVFGPATKLRAVSVVGSAAALLSLFVVQAGFAFTGHPSLERAKQELAAGNVDVAAALATACVDLDRDADGAREVLDGIHLQRVAATSDLAAATALARESFFDPAAAEQAQAEVSGRVIEAIGATQAAGDFSSTRSRLALLPEAQQMEPVVLGFIGALALHEAAKCIGILDGGCFGKALDEGTAARISADQVAGLRKEADAAAHVVLDPLWSTIRSSSKPLEHRSTACTEARKHVPFVVAATSPSFRPSANELESRCVTVAEQLDAKIKADEEAKRREEARLAEKRAREEARLAEKRAREEAYRRWANAPLRCNDGTLSPSCTCGGGARRGCCSRHSGVAGCSQ